MLDLLGRYTLAFHTSCIGEKERDPPNEFCLLCMLHYQISPLYRRWDSGEISEVSPNILPIIGILSYHGWKMIWENASNHFSFSTCPEVKGENPNKWRVQYWLHPCAYTETCSTTIVQCTLQFEYKSHEGISNWPRGRRSWKTESLLQCVNMQMAAQSESVWDGQWKNTCY